MTTIPNTAGDNRLYAARFFWEKRDFWIIFILAFVVRAVAVWWLNFAPVHLRPTMVIFAPDSVVYDSIAQNLLHGEGYHWGGDYKEISSVPPLYSVLLSFVYGIFGSGVATAGMANAIFGAFTAWLIYQIAWNCFAPNQADSEQSSINTSATRKIALLAGLIFAVYPLEVFNTPFVLKENFSIFLTVGFLLAWIQMLRAPSQRALIYFALWAGFALGLSILSRLIHQGIAVIFVLTMLYFWCKQHKVLAASTLSRSQILISTGVVLLTCMVTVSPWLVRNYRIYGQIVMSPQGPSRYLFNATSKLAQKESNGYYEGRGKLVQHNMPINIKTQNDPQGRERIFARLALRNFLENPAHIVHLTGGKLVSMWRPLWENSSLRSWILLGIPYLAMMFFALPGLFLAARLRALQSAPNQPLQVLFAVTFFYILGHALFYGMIRERQYVEPYLIIFAVAAIVYFQLRWPRKRSETA